MDIFLSVINWKKAFKYLNGQSTESILVWNAIAIVFVALIAGLVIFKYKKEYLKHYYTGVACSFVVYVLMALSIMIPENIKSEDTKNHLYMFIIAIVMLVIFVFGISVFNIMGNKGSKISSLGARKKIIAISIGLVFVLLAIILFAVSMDKFNKQNLADITFEDGGVYYDKILPIALILVSFSMISLFIGGFTLVFALSKEKAYDTKFMAQSAVCIALAFTLSYIRFFRLPQGGSITLAGFLPIAIIAYMYGLRRGLLVAFIYGLLQAVQDPWIVHPIQFILDYPVAFTMIGFAGVFRNIKKLPIQVRLVLGIALVAILRYLAHLVSGAVFFGGAVGGKIGGAEWKYSAGYNAFVFADAAIIAFVGALLTSSKQVVRIIEENQARMLEAKMDECAVEA